MRILRTISWSGAREWCAKCAPYRWWRGRVAKGAELRAARQRRARGRGEARMADEIDRGQANGGSEAEEVSIDHILVDRRET